MQVNNLTSKQDSGVSTMKEDPKIKNTGGLEKSKITEKSHDSNEPNTSNYQILKDKQNTVLKSLININEDQLTKLPEPPHPNDEIAFKTVSYKRNRKVQFGQAEISEYDEINGFVGRDRENKKVWLFISRVKEHVTEDNIKKYLDEKTKNKGQIYGKEIDTYKKTTDNKCFEIGINIDFKEDAYSSIFWPRGVAVYKFDFKKGEKYRNRINRTDEMVHSPMVQQAENFQ
ncbi:hypothetical protein JTB14_002775 [Gonioctena quinquepunctata]|nr:hypothetical protein JTB14_002775 [Gonioctena quinquepunctata]